MEPLDPVTDANSDANAGNASNSDAIPGQKVTIDGFETSQADAELNPKKKVWERIQTELKVNSEGIAEWRNSPLKIVGFEGLIRAKSLKDVPIK